MEAMEEVKKPGPWGTSVKWGIIGGIAVVLVSYLGSLNVDWTNFAEIEKARGNWTQWTGYLILALAIVMAQIEHKKRELGGFMGYGRGVGVASIIGLVSGICAAIYMFFFFGIMHPEFQQMVIEQGMARMQDVPPAQEEQAIKMMKMFSSPTAMSMFTLAGNFFVALVIGLIASIFTQKNQPY